MKRLLLASAIVALVGCRGDEQARVKITGVGQTATAEWKANEGAKAKVWIDFDGSWTGHENDPGLVYEIDVRDGDKSVQTLTCSTASCSTHVCSTTTTIGSKHKGDCECKTNCVLDAPSTGTFTVHATATNPDGNFNGKNASVVLRQ